MAENQDFCDNYKLLHFSLFKIIKGIFLSEVFLYLIFGFLTTVVNVVVFWIFRRINVSVQFSTMIAWFISVLFAFFTNRTFVFKANSSNSDLQNKKKVFFQMFAFFASRLFSGVIDFFMMSLLCKNEQINEVAVKIFVNIFVIILNFILSKAFVFKNALSNKNGENANV